MIEMEEYKKFISETFSGEMPKIKIAEATDYKIFYPIVQLNFGQSYMSYQTIISYNPIVKAVTFIPVRFGNGWFEIKDWAEKLDIYYPEKFHKVVYEFIRDLKEYEKREKILKMKLEAII